jgi:polyhydroxybutyrate depolymerase
LVAALRAANKLKRDMKFKILTCVTAFLLAPLAFLYAAENGQPGGVPLSQGFSHIEMTVDGVSRDALIYAPSAAASTSCPLVFVFHGHGGSARQAARSLAMSREWPEAISVYMQGLNTPGALTDPDGKKAGWQHGAGSQNDRDLKFFDAMLERVKRDYKVDPQRIYATGHSNGGGFTYLLWETRPDVFAAFAPVSAAAKNAAKMKPKPAIHIAGANDPLVKFEWQKLTMDAVRKVNGCDEEGKPWGDNCTIYASKSGTPFVAFIHPGGHEVPPGAPSAIVKLFKEHPAVER